MAHQVENMFSVRQVPWHKKGKILNNPPTSKEAIIQAGLDWTVNKKDLYFKNGEGFDLGEFNKIDKRSALVRSTDNSVLSVVSNRYNPLQNIEAFEWFDTFVESGLATYETAGSLQNGKKIWILAKLKDDFEVIKGDPARKYIFLANGHDGITGIMIQPTSVRVVCNNTWQRSISTGLVNTIWHNSKSSKNMDEVKNLLGLAEEQFIEQKEFLLKMSKFPISDVIVNAYLEKVLPTPDEKKSETAWENNKIWKNRIVALSETGLGTDIPGVKGNLYGLYNAAVEFAEYDMGRTVKDTGNFQLFGLGAQFKSRAWNSALDLIK